MSKKFTHLDSNDNPSMVNVGTKKVSKRKAIAQAIIKVNKEVLALMEGDEIKTKKGPIFQTAILAGIMGAKKTSDLIPLCHPLSLEKCHVAIVKLDDTHIKVTCETSLESKTGVEMEALAGATVAALTIYDMCKSFGHEMVIKEVKLLEKSGGKSDYKVKM